MEHEAPINTLEGRVLCRGRHSCLRPFLPAGSADTMCKSPRSGSAATTWVMPPIRTTAVRLVRDAVDGGITFFDNCWEYHRGKTEDWMGKGLKGIRDRVFLMTKVCTHGRDKDLALRMLDESLRRLQTDHLDLWQIHGVSFDNDPDLFMRKGGAAEALEQAKKQGKARFVGFTGHKDPVDSPENAGHRVSRSIPCRCRSTLSMPAFTAFEQQVLPGVEPPRYRGLGHEAAQWTWRCDQARRSHR